MLNGLELASPYQWKLSHLDLFSENGSYFNRDQIQLTILVGIEDYSGLRGWVNKPGTDGTVVIAGTSLNSIKPGLDFSSTSEPYKWKEKKTAHDFSFGVLPGLDHGSIVDKFEKEESQVTKLTVEALKEKDGQVFENFRDRLDWVTDQTYEFYANKMDNKYSRYQQFILSGVDDHDAPFPTIRLNFMYTKLKRPMSIWSNQRDISTKRKKTVREISPGTDRGDPYK